MADIPATDWQKVDAILKTTRKAIISSHIHPEGDALGSQMALGDYLISRGLEVRFVNHDPVPRVYAFLDPESRIERPDAAGLTEFARDAAGFAVDTSDWERLGDAAPFIRDHARVRIRIDHHRSAKMDDVDLALVDEDTPSTGELIFQLIDTLGGGLTLPIANCLYVAILTDTGSFRFSSTRPSTHRTAARLIEAGVNPESCWENVYQRSTWNRMDLISRLLQTLRPECDGRVACFHLTRADIHETGCQEEDVEGVIDVPRILDKVDVYVFAREAEDGSIKVSLRSRGGFDVRDVAQRFDGGGHLQASGLTYYGAISEAFDAVLGVIRPALDCR